MFEDGLTPDHGEDVEPRQLGRNSFGNPGADPLVTGLSRDVDERNDGHRAPARSPAYNISGFVRCELLGVHRPLYRGNKKRGDQYELALAPPVS